MVLPISVGIKSPKGPKVYTVGRVGHPAIRSLTALSVRETPKGVPKTSPLGLPEDGGGSKQLAGRSRG